MSEDRPQGPYLEAIDDRPRKVGATGEEYPKPSGFIRSYAVYPAQHIPVAFDHKVHLEGGANCETCHERALKSQKSSDLNLPPGHPRKGSKESTCEDCHDVEAARKGKRTDPPSECQVCHTGFDQTVQRTPPKWEFPEPNIHFPHEVHVARRVKCEVCHLGIEQAKVATRDQLPKMAVCLKCHDGRQASAECRSCHLAPARGGRLSMTFTNTRASLRPEGGNPFGIDHGPRFDKNHGARALMEQNLCMECHGDAECLRCHDGLGKPLTVHPNNYLAVHPIQARQDAVRCDACHRRQTFCAACHERAGVGWDSDPSFQPRNVRVHPPYNVWVAVVGPKHHALAASRDLPGCVSCHREETCMSCHSTVRHAGLRNNLGFIGRSPHPPTFNRVCKGLAARNDRACLKCHTADALVTLGCR